MKKLLLLIFLCAILLAACGPSDESCQLNWDSMEAEPDDESLLISMILNREHAPGTVGEVLQKCIQKGWRP